RVAIEVLDDDVAAVADGAPILRPVFEPGDALLFDELFLHRTATSPGVTDARYAIESWSFAPSPFPPEYFPLVWSAPARRRCAAGVLAATGERYPRPVPCGEVVPWSPR